MKKFPEAIKILSFIALIAVLFYVPLIISSGRTLRALESEAKNEMSRQQAENEMKRASWERENENRSYEEIDYYSMSEFSRENSESVMAALKSGDKDALMSILISTDSGYASQDDLSKALDEILEYADWSQADFENAVSMGSGSLMAEPDDEGRMDVSERFFVNADGTKYVLFIESICSKSGRTNDGISAIAVTSYRYFDNVEYGWLGEKTDSSVLAGELFWNRE